MMKYKNIISIVVIIVSLFYSFSVFANEKITVFVDNKEIKFDVQPCLTGGRTMVPLRAIGEALNVNVEWHEETQSITAYNEAYFVKCSIGNNILTVNNEQKTIDIPPMIINDRTLVPVRFIAEAFNCDVSWIAETMTVNITSYPINYNQLEKEAKSDNDVLKYYNSQKIFLPTYTYITGTPLKTTHESEEINTYIYDFNKSDFVLYLETLRDTYKWNILHSEEDTEKLLLRVYLTDKDSNVVGIIFDAYLNEIWILIYN